MTGAPAGAGAPEGTSETDAPAGAEPVVPAAPPVKPAAGLTVAAGRGLFAMDPKRNGFFAVAAGEPVPTGVPLVVPEPLRATIAVAGVPLSIELLGGTRALFAAAETDGAAVGLAVADGRVRLTRLAGAGAGAGDEPAAVVVGAGGAKWRLIPSMGATAAIAVEPRRPRGAGADLAGSPGRAALAALNGPVEAVDLAPGSTGQTVSLPAGSTAALVTQDGRLAAPGAAGAAAAGLFVDGVPGWAAGAAPSEADLLMAEQFGAALLPGQPLEVSLPALIEDEEVIPASQAVAALALAGRAGDLARALKRTPHPSVVLVAADGLRTLLGRNPEMDAEVNDALTLEFPPEARLALARLLDRLTAAEARDPEISAQVVDALESSELAVRTLAIAELERLTGVTKAFGPHDSPSQRDNAVKRWRRELDRTGALLDPNAAPEQPIETVDPPGLDLDAVIPDDL